LFHRAKLWGSALQGLVKELLAHLPAADDGFRPALAARLCGLVQRFAPSARWYVDSLLAVMVAAGRHVAVRALPLPVLVTSTVRANPVVMTSTCLCAVMLPGSFGFVTVAACTQ
jgi:hypothetical protein